jgi:putative cardiolipin synthase
VQHSQLQTKHRNGRSLFAAGVSLLACCALLCASLAVAEQSSKPALGFIDAQIAAHPGESGAYVLDTGEEALIARAWLADHAERTIEVQYFIWSTDNIGILAAEALLRAAERGVKVRVIVDDLLMDAPAESLLALARHPNIDIRVYNPTNSVGVSLYERMRNVFTDFRGFNQRMHDKTFVVDGKVAVTGGRNMAAEYYDYHHEYNFRDRDALVVGAAVQLVRANFERFWSSPLSRPVESLYDESGHVDDGSVAKTGAAYRDLHAYANSPDNFAPEIHKAIEAAPSAFERMAQQTAWGHIDFIGDRPGKNDGTSLSGGGLATRALAELVAQAKTRIVIQSPYLVLSPEALELFKKTSARGVQIRINTNSLASTDNPQAFAGYRNQRDALLKLGLQIFEYRPDAVSALERRQQELVHALPAAANPVPKFGLHAKTMVIDSSTVFIGTFNLDPRSANLNTETGVVIHSEAVARSVEQAIEVDMQSGNSWNALRDDPDAHVSIGKRAKVRFWQLMPMKPLL